MTRLVKVARRQQQLPLENVMVYPSPVEQARRDLIEALADLLKKQFTVGKAKTQSSSGRVVPLNDAALDALTAWRARWPHAEPEDYIFPTEKLVFRGAGSPGRRVMDSYAVDKAKPLGSWKTAWRTAREQARVECRMHDLRHSVVSKSAVSGIPAEVIRAISGHSTQQMQDLYTHVEQEPKRQALAKVTAQETVQ